MAIRPRHLKRLRKIGVYLLVLIVAAFCAEWVSRAMKDEVLDPKKNPLRAFDPALSHTFKPFLTTDIVNPAGERVVIDINSLGLRDREITSRKTGELRIVGLGDSFTAATLVPLSDCYLKGIERMASDTATADRTYRFVNAGIDGYSLEQDLQLLVKFSETLDPDVVLVGLYVGDDVRDYGQPRGLALPAKESLRKKSYLYHVLQRGYRRIRGGRGEEPAEDDPDRMARWRECFAQYDESPEDEAIVRYVHAARSEVPIHSKRGIGEAARSGTENALSEIRDVTGLLDAKLLLVLLPTKRQVLPLEWEKTARLLDVDPGDYDLDQPQEVLMESAARLQIPVVDLLPVFRSYPSSDSLYWKGYPHWTPEAHRLAAESIHEFLVRGDFLK